VNKLFATAAFAIVGIGIVAGSASAMTAAPRSRADNSLLQTIAGGCGRGFHPNPWGRCVPSHYDDYGSGYDESYRPAPRYDYQQQPRYGYQQDPGYGYDDGGYAPQRIDRGGCPRGRHPGNSGRCVKDY
jgi:hypothetical protein